MAENMHNNAPGPQMPDGKQTPTARHGSGAPSQPDPLAHAARPVHHEVEAATVQRKAPRPKKDEDEENLIYDESDKEVQISKITRTPTLNTFITGSLKATIYLTVVIVLSVCLAIGAIMIGNDVFALVKDDSVIEVTITDGISLDETAQLLYENNIIKYPGVFKIFAGLKDVDPNEFIAGTYKLSPAMNYEQLCRIFVPRKEREIVRITIPEGSSVPDIISIFTEQGIGTKEGFVEAINNTDYTEYFPFLTDVYAACTPERVYKLEGYLYPDTYDFYSDSKESQIIYKLLENFNAKFSQEMLNDAKEAGWTMDEIIIVASLVQKEAFHYEDYDKIASVFYNRLANPKTYPKLESDATTAYAIELATGERPDFIGAAEVAFDHPYNTRVYDGLMPGAICNPGYEAIMCAIYPAKTNYYFFVTDNDGYNVFTRTYEEHIKAVQKIEREKELLEQG